MGQSTDEPVTVLATGDPLLLGLAESLLDEVGITYVAKGEALQDVIGVGRFGIGMNPIVGPVELQVHPDDAARARELLRDLDSNGDEAEPDPA